MRTMTFMLVGALFVSACAENALPPESPTGMAGDYAVEPPEPPLPPNTLRRSVVRRAVADGVGAFLQRVELDDRPIFAAGKFHGFRIASLRGDPRFWSGVDLRPGDVVTRVNGLAIEHPEDAMQALQSLEVASELRVEYERGGEARELRFNIVDDEAPTGQASAKAPPPPPASAFTPLPKPSGAPPPLAPSASASSAPPAAPSSPPPKK